MRIQYLFNKLQEINTADARKKFESSGMLNIYQQFDSGFFPVGSGRLEPSPQDDIKEGGIMILGNDWGTEDYLNKRRKREKEMDSSPTIRNLKELQFRSEITFNFYTNFYLGVRSIQSASTMTRRKCILTDCFKKACFDFFKIQLMLIDPATIICLGNAVRRALVENTSLFSEWRPLSKSITKLYESGKFIQKINDEELGNRKFILIPHPCDSRNFNSKKIQKILKILQSEKIH